MNHKRLNVSLVIPAYNEERYLETCLKAIEAQTVKPLEVLVVNNNSTDKTAEVAAGFNRVRVINETRQGIVFARNAGFDNAQGDVIGRIDADTILPENWVEKILDFYSKEDNLNSACTGYAYFYNLHMPNFSGRFGEQIAIRFNWLLLGHYILYGSNMAMPKTIWQKIKSSTCSRTDIHEDMDLAVHAHRGGFKIVYLPHLKVGVMARRISGPDRAQQWPFLMLWPQTLRVHKLWSWIICWATAVLLYVCSPIMLLIEKRTKAN